MKKIFASIIGLVLFVANPVMAQDFKYRKEVRESTFAVHTFNERGEDTGCGTGVIAKIDKDGTTWVLTAAHVTSKAKKVKLHEELREDKKVKLHEELREDKKVVGEVYYDAEIMKESPDEDLALLRVKRKNLGKAVVFGNHKKIEIDSDVAVCGTFAGEHQRVVTVGKIQGFDCEGLHKKCRYNMVTMTIYRGTSGGGMYDMDGKYIGMFVALRPNGIAYYITVEDIRKWAKAEKIDFIFNDKAKRPKTLKPIER